MKPTPTISIICALVTLTMITSIPTVAGVPSKELAPPSIRMLDYNQMRAITEITQRIESMMALAQNVSTRVWVQGLRDPDGRVGLFIACSRPFITPSNTTGMDARKAWVLLAVFAITKHTEGSPVSLDYIGFTDQSGLIGEHWFYRLEMSTARQVQHQLFAHAITMEQAYDKVIAAWHRVGPEG